MTLEEAIIQLAQHRDPIAMIEQLIKDDCEQDRSIRELAKPYVDVDGDTIYVPTLLDIVEQLIARIEYHERKSHEGLLSRNNISKIG
jgi:hypothetical protein